MLTSRTALLCRVAAVCCLPLLGPEPVKGQETGLTPQERKQLDSEARRLIKGAFAQYQKGDDRDAIRRLERALAVLERLHAKRDHLDLSECLTGLGAVLKALGQAGKALPYYERALAMRERLYGKRDHPELAVNLNNLGTV